MRYLESLLFFCVLINFAFPQQRININNIRALYETFEYRDVIKQSDSLIAGKGILNKSDLTEVLMMKAVSHYALAEEDKARKCFIEMLKIDRHLELDSEKVSPKIVGLFNEVKTDFMQVIPEEQRFLDNKLEPANQFSTDIVTAKFQDQKSSIIRSFLFPGWGHIYSGNITKGAIIASAAVINLGALIYFITDANSKEKKYLNATNEDVIKINYNIYNRSYKTRNILISSILFIYTYAQIDFFYLGGDGGSNIKLGIGDNESDPNKTGVAFLLKIGF